MPKYLSQYHFYEKDWADYEELHAEFEWEVPEKANIASYICDRWAEKDSEQVALYSENAAGEEGVYTFTDIRDSANQLADYFETIGIGSGDRIGVFLPVRPAAAIAHIAAWKLGAVTIPLSTLFGTEAVRYRLNDGEADVCIVDEQTVETYRKASDGLNGIEHSLTVGDIDTLDTETDFWDAVEGMSTDYDTAETNSEDTAVIIYTSGTTGDPKGVVHGHRVLFGHLPSIVATLYRMDVTDDDVVYGIAEWSWIAGLFATLCSAWYYGSAVVAYNDHGNQFDPENALRLIEKYDVTSFFAIGSALRAIQNQVDDISDYSISSLRGILTAMGDEELYRWCADNLGVYPVDGYGQTEANMFIGEILDVMDLKDGTIGKPLPGHEATLLDPETAEPSVDVGEIGEFALRYDTGDPVCMKEFLNKPEKTEEKFQNGWLLTGDLGRRDEDGYYEFVSRKDDVIKYSGYRMGPEEIENSLQSHESVLEAGVAGVEVEGRGMIPKAFVVLTEDGRESPQLKEELQAHVRERLAEYQYPREIEFIEGSLPRTSTGKLQRYKLGNDSPS